MMKLIQILVLTAAIAAASSGQSTGANNSKPGAKQPGAAPARSPVVVTHPAPRNKPASASKKKTSKKVIRAEKKAAPARGMKAHASGKAIKVAKKPAATSRRPAPAASTRARGAKPAISVGSLPAKKKPLHGRMGHVPSVRANGAKTRARARVVARPARPTVSTRAGKKAKSARPRVRMRAGKKPKSARPRVGSRPPRPAVAKVEKAPKPQRKPRTKLLGAAGRRDPFVSPIRSANAVSPTSSCRSGKRCLSIPELVLQGTVRDISGRMLAVVTTSNRKTYTLRENDQVFNGSVEKITTDSIIFREYVRDPMGRESAREVVKKLGPTS